MTISYSFSQRQGAPGKHRPEDDSSSGLGNLWRLDSLDVHGADAAELLVINRQTRRRALMGANIQGLFALFQEFRTIEEHQKHALQALSQRGLTPVPVDALLEDLLAAGLMVTAEEWLSRFPASEARPSETRDWVLAIATCDRPAYLRRLLNSLAPHVSGTVRPRSVLLIDDSRQPEHVDQNREVFGEWLGATALDGAVWDRERRGRFVQTLLEAFPGHRRTLRWLLDPSAFPADVMTVGQVRNFATLMTAGYEVLALDDDCVAQPFLHPGSASGLRLRSHAGELHPYAEPDAMWGDAQSIDLNPLQAHLDALGSPLQGAFAALGQTWRATDWIRSVDPLTHARLLPDAMVGLTSNAVLGDPGLGDLTAFYAKPSGNVEERIAFLDAVDADQPLSRLFWRGGVHSWVSFGSPLLTSTLTGLDNRLLVPPGGPTGRGSDDRMLGAVLSGLYPQLGRLEFNWALPHLPEQWRPWKRPGADTGTADPDPPALLIDAADHGAARLQGHGPDQRLAELAHHFAFLAHGTDASLRIYADERVVEGTLARMQGFRTNLRHPAMRGAMRDDLERLLRRGEAQAARPFVPDVQWLRYFRASCEVYSDALTLWPELRKWAQAASPAMS